MEEIFTLRKQLKQKKFKPFECKDAFDAGAGAPYFTVGLKTPEGMRLEQMYRRLGYEGFDLVKAEHDTWLEAQYTEQQNDALFSPLLDSASLCRLRSQVDSLRSQCSGHRKVPGRLGSLENGSGTGNLRSG